MIKRKRKKIFLISSLLSLGAIIICIILLPPTSSISLTFISLPLYGVVMFLLGIFFYSLIAYLFRSFIHGILVGLFPVIYLIMRLNDLTSPLIFVLLAAIFVVLEILLVQFTRKHS